MHNNGTNVVAFYPTLYMLEQELVIISVVFFRVVEMPGDNSFLHLL